LPHRLRPPHLTLLLLPLPAPPLALLLVPPPALPLAPLLVTPPPRLPPTLRPLPLPPRSNRISAIRKKAALGRLFSWVYPK
ncbi:hypothetical protein, partial [Ramlibacter sp. WS9]|uniref:hypothetical protein n=1 Tax=Ramlibacter sp. WS9 TaxID=1882741 RepID=UPI00117260F7